MLDLLNSSFVMSCNELQALVLVQQKKLDEAQKKIENMRKKLEVLKPHFLLDSAGFICIAQDQYDYNRLFQVSHWLDSNLETSYWEHWGNMRVSLCVTPYHYLDFAFAPALGINFRYYRNYMSARFSHNLTDHRRAETMIDQLESIFKSVLDKDMYGNTEKALQNYQVVVEFCAQCREILWKK